MEQVIIFSHIIAGSGVLLSGFIIMLMPKYSPVHKKVGWVYVIFMWWVCSSAILSITFFRFSLFLLVIAIMTFHATFNGFRVMRRNRYQKIAWFDYLASVIVLIAGCGLITYGGYLIYAKPMHIVLGSLSILFGVFTSSGAVSDIKFFVKGDLGASNWWLYQHVNAMGGSYIAAVTALAVQNGGLLSLSGTMAWLPWILPGVIGGSILRKVIRQMKQKRRALAISS